MENMTEQQIPVFMARLVEFQKLFSQLSKEDAQWVIQNTSEAISLFDKVVKERDKSILQLLEPVGTIDIPATTEKFVAKNHFGVDITEEAEIKISYLGDNFRFWFLNKSEEPFPGSTLRYQTLKKGSVDGPIIAEIELDGKAKAEITLTELRLLLKKQPKGENGVLLTDGYANIFYIRDIDAVLRAVFVRWDGPGWYLYAYSVEYPAEWTAGIRVFSRNSCDS